MSKALKIEDLGNIIYRARMTDRYQFLDEKTLDTVLEDIHILIERGFNDLEIGPGNLIKSLDKLCDIMDTIGYTTSGNFYNTLRILCLPTVKHDFDMSLENLLRVVQKSIFAYNIKLRNSTKCQSN